MFKNEKKIIAAFDFDNTLIDRDSLLPFLFYTTGTFATIYRLLMLIPAFLQFCLKRLSRQEIKEKILSTFFKDKNILDLKKQGKIYADTILDRFIKPEALAKLQWHQDQKHDCVLVSASVDLYLTPWAERHGIKSVLASRLEVTPNSLVTGKLVGSNCWGEEKRRRFLKEFGSKENYTLYFYGDSRGDQEMLEFADYPFYRKY